MAHITSKYTLPLVIGIGGKKSVGKDTFGSFLCDYGGFRKFSLSDTLKIIVSELFDWDINLLYGNTEQSREWRETFRDQYWVTKFGNDFTPRKALQVIGTDVFRNTLSYDFWCWVMERKIKLSGYPRIVIPDVRFPNEIALVKKIFQGITVYIVRNLPEHAHDGHISENAIDQGQFDHVIYNESTLDNLRLEAKKFLGNIVK